MNITILSVRHVAKRLGVLLLSLIAVMAVGLWLADMGMAHPGAITRLHRWMDSTRYLWLTWRLTVYALLAWGVWKIWHAPGCRPEYKAPLLRIAVAGALFLLVCEYALSSAPGVTA
jgi:uncharacterized membrane protein